MTDERYNVLKFKGKKMIGTHLFKSGQTSEGRRSHRSARRRLNRKNNRIKILRELFSEEICKVDPGFYQRLDDSFFWSDDKKVEQKNSIFNDKDFTDKNYHDKFPTIYHLRSYLIHTGEKADIRLVYLALHNIIKRRGHFLFKGEDISISGNLNSLLKELNKLMEDLPSLTEDMEVIPEDKIDDIADILKDQDKGLSEKKKAFIDILKAKAKSPIITVLNLMAGSKIDLQKIFPEVRESLKVSLKNDLEDFKSKNSEFLTEDIEEFLDLAKMIYDTVLLSDILQGKEYLSDAKINSYDQHKKDLKLLKRVYKEHLPSKYKAFFKTDNENYSAYIYNNNKKSKKRNKLNQEDINKIIVDDVSKAIKNLEEKNEEIDQDILDLYERANLGQLLPKQRTGENSLIPYQLHKRELIKILENQKKYYPFLSRLDDRGISTEEKILKTFQFRIPYYVGPLNDEKRVEEGGFSWVEKRSRENIYPWNFEEIVDEKKSAQKFIKNMTNTCTYLLGEDVLPKDSLLYQEFEVLNDINAIKINDKRIENDLKKLIFEEFFVKSYRPRLTKKALIEGLQALGYLKENDRLEGIDINVKSSLRSYHSFKNLIGDKVRDRDMVEKIIFWGTIYNEAKKMFKSNIEEEYGDLLSGDEIDKITKLNYRGWGRLSKKFLTGIIPEEDKNSGIGSVSIIKAMRENSLILMEILSQKYGYSDLMDKENESIFEEESVEEMIDNSYTFPAVKRTMYRAIDIVDEIEKTQGRPAKKIFLEMARGDAPKVRTKSRRDQLLELYKSLEDEDSKRMYEEIDKRPEEDFNIRKVYLYYTQMGRCMYTGKKINIEDLSDDAKFDKDHIYPQSLVKDDSILNNLVLTDKYYNEHVKKNVYPVNSETQKKMRAFWTYLLEKGFITKEKFYRLNRREAFTSEEKTGFINRQMVETRQSTKEVSKILEAKYEDSTIIYSKAGNVSDFRHDFDLLKVREINNLHHAEDAYLNIVVGNTYYTKFTKNPYKFLKDKENRGKSIKKDSGEGEYNLKTIFKGRVEDKNCLAWDPDRDIETVKREMKNPYKQFTRYAYTNSGKFYDQLSNKLIASKGKGYFPIKASDPRLEKTDRYGAYGSIAIAYYSLIDHRKGKKIIRTLVAIPLVYKEKIKDKEDLVDYCKNKLNYEDIKILIPKIKFNAKFKINGFYYHIGGKTGGSSYFIPAVQLILEDEDRLRVRELLRIEGGRKAYKPELVTESELINFYDRLEDKIENTIYRYRDNFILDLLKNNRDAFKKLKSQDKAKILLTIVRYLNAVNESYDFTLITGKKSKNKIIGYIRMNRNINKKNREFILINESATGLYSNEIDLLGEFK